jgi:serine/threonine protein kinase
LEVVGPLDELVKKTNDLRVLGSIPAFARSDAKPADYKQLVSRIVELKVGRGEKVYTTEATDKAGIYILRSGTVKVNDMTVTKGGYFGVKDTLFTDAATSEAVAEDDCVIGLLSKTAIVSVIKDITRMQIGAKKPMAKAREIIKLSELKKHRILGVGTFGKVWLTTRNDNKEVYALKVQRKRLLLQHQQVEGVLREIKIMADLDHPFVLNLVNVYQDADSIQMLIKLVQGGELYSIMKRHRKQILPERDAKFYASGILEGLSYMHSRDILYRDLKPENVLIDKTGYTVIVDLGFAKHVPDKTFTLCGTPWYIAPEVILGRGHDKACDHWSWAILVHEMTTGETPFGAAGSDQMTLFKAIARGTYKISKRCNEVVEDMVRRILVTKPSLRLGSLAGGEQDIKQHDWLSDVDFDKLVQKKFRAPWKPSLADDLDVSEFDNWDHMAADERTAPLSSEEQAQFTEIDSINEDLSS